MLELVKLRTNLKYAGWGLPGALALAWLQPDVIRQLAEADAEVRRQTAGRGEILVWDALRTFECQRFLFERELALAAERAPHLSARELELHVEAFVRPPRVDLPPPHTTGGAVDCTILWEGSDTVLGEFDDFSERGRPDYFERHTPHTSEDALAAWLRHVQREAMLGAGFVGIDSEWWHYELGTRTWALQTGCPVLFDEVVKPPRSDAVAGGLPQFPARNPIHVSGVAQAFSGPVERTAALSGVVPGYYYVRTRHHAERQVAQLLGSLLGADDAVLLPSGLSAALASVAGTARPGDLVVVDKQSYYETRGTLAEVAGEAGWRLQLVDFDDARATDTAVKQCPSVVFCDHPRNWMLTMPDLARIRASTALVAARLVVDISVQPLQRLTSLRLADVVTLSLSKYPAAGATVGGAVLGDAKTLDATHDWARRRGLLLAPEAALTVLLQLQTLEDRLAAVSAKARTIADLLAGFPEVAEVRLPDLSHVGGALSGGQVGVRFISEAFARRLEQVVGWNSAIGRDFPLTLACTFGTHFTTFENFGARTPGGGEPIAGADVIGPEWVRIGIGHEPIDAIVAALRFAAELARQYQQKAA